ncbi:GntR family transcriptional regulator [Motiliproteus sp. MSK22-1]|uniref:GntR family transcriptional regulator n=1 Tax=Motiliproteus sp. MSK22-1 TaxID=1897630 RepID=UPI000978AF41|nr:GntR family transcriptional regulator [Motiliproteus sp. MSK22-1]OMH37961.1 hypothetical protein BGP75_06645 [Motiliproteus sp. MSK22-1]
MRQNDQTIEKSNLAERVYAKIRDSLTAGEYMPGDRLRISQMAKAFGTSNTPVREALLRLVSEHALDMQAATKIVVPELSLPRYIEIRTVRCSLEAMAAEAAMACFSPDEIKKLREINKLFAKSEKDNDSNGMFIHNREFHFYIYERCGMPILLAMINNMAASMGPILRAFYQQHTQTYSEGAAQHNKIIDALSKKDGSTVKTALKNDLLMAGPSIEKFLQDYEEEQRQEAINLTQ